MENHKEKFDECLPDSYTDNIVTCDYCDKWFHHECANYDMAILKLVTGSLETVCSSLYNIILF